VVCAAFTRSMHLRSWVMCVLVALQPLACHRGGLAGNSRKGDSSCDSIEYSRVDGLGSTKDSAAAFLETSVLADADGEVGLPMKDCMPDCISRLRVGCRGSGKGDEGCIMDNSRRVVCFPNGVTWFYYSYDGVTVHPSIMVTMPDGRTPCYYIDHPGRVGGTDYLDSNGVLVATQDYVQGGVAVTCIETSEVYQLPASALTDPDAGCRPANCTEGSCD